MSANYTNLPHLDRETILRLKTVERFADFMLWSWAIAETNIDLVFLRQFDIDYFDTKNRDNRLFLRKAGLTRYLDSQRKKGDFLLRTPYSAKFEFLQTMKIFTHKEAESIRTLLEGRIALFHGRLFRKNITAFTDEDKRKMMDEAHRAAFVLFKRTLRVLFPNSKPPPKAEVFMDVPSGG